MTLEHPTILMVDPAHFDVSYTINPWMDPGRWSVDAGRLHEAARSAWTALRAGLTAAGCNVITAAGAPGLPDMVFPANAAVVLDGKAVMARFRHPERRGEERLFVELFESLRGRGLVQDIVMLPDGCWHEGAGDCMWDATRGWFWAGYGPRSSRRAIDRIEEAFGRPCVPLELATERCYHLDVCFCPLSGGDILYYPEAFTDEGRRAIEARVDPDRLIVATEEDLLRFSVNAFDVDRRVFTARSTPRLRDALAERGYGTAEFDVSPFLLAGGGAHCMVLRLDRTSVYSPVRAETENTLA